jgi:hypothetical protein
MTLDEIGQTALRRWWLLVLPALLAAGITTVLWLNTAPGYTAVWRLMIGPIDAAAGAQSDGWDVTERVLDDLAAVVDSAAFADAVAAQSGGSIDAAGLRGAFSVVPLHRSLTLQVRQPTAAAAEAALPAAIELLRSDGLRFWGQRGGLPIVVLDQGQAAVDRDLRGLVIDSGLRAALGLTAGLAAALWLERIGRPTAGGRR